ncbi:peptidylprolyl isomerase [Cellulosilyticum sp. I15G10I2]|uniref:peptidylprolyl isomerase n=1 Tax=Cellulosilyticum sp. I15G10I2 TaxID=1892843 RepID=UPI000B06A9B1|nr:peptidylprolyl isomerase [Cellulosilyticum sp. I15G10I2]
MKKISMVFVIIVLSMGTFYSINQATNQDKPPDSSKDPVVTMILEDNQTVKIELYPQYAPNTVNNFIDLINKKFYDGMSFSRIVPNYLVQTGDPIGDGTGFPGYFIKSECKQNGVKNKIKCEEGVICMSRSKRYNTEGSQFFILLQDDLGLNGQYTAFGKIIEGMDVLQEIGKTPVNEKNIPQEEIKIKTITVDTFGIHYDEPQVISIYEQRNKS